MTKGWFDKLDITEESRIQKRNEVLDDVKRDIL